LWLPRFSAHHRGAAESFTGAIQYEPEGESTKPEDEDVDTEDLEWDKTEGDETSVKQTDDEES
jgi:hypothetical protein